MTAKRQPQSSAYAPMETIEDAAVPKYLIFVSASSRILSLARPHDGREDQDAERAEAALQPLLQVGFGGGDGRLRRQGLVGDRRRRRRVARHRTQDPCPIQTAPPS